MSITCARPYAKATFQYAKSCNLLNQWHDLLLVSGRLGDDPIIRNMLISPTLNIDKKIENIVYLLNTTDKYFQHFLYVLAKNQRLLLLPWIAIEFTKLKNEDEQIQNVMILSAYSIPSAYLSLLKQKLEKRLGQNIRINTEIDSSLIGGIKICANDWVYEDTVQRRLKKLATEIIV